MHEADAPRVQLTVRAAVAGMLLGGFMSLSNLYIVLKTGWSFGVTITSGILAWAIFALLLRARVVRSVFGILENNAMQSVASAAGYMIGGGTAAAIPALMMITGEVMDPWQMFVWIAAIAFLGVVMAIPMKQQMIDVEQLRFPSGVAAAETLRALHGSGEGRDKAQMLGAGAVVGAVVAWLRDGKVAWMPWNLPEKLAIPGGLLLRGRPLTDWTLSFEGSLILVSSGAIMGFRAAWSMLLGAVVTYAVLAPQMYARGVIDPKLGYSKIVAWSVWAGSAMLLTSGLLAFAFQWRSVVGALRSLGSAFARSAGAGSDVPLTWFVAGVGLFGPIVIFLEWAIFGIAPWLGVISVLLSFFIAIVACRVTGETDTTPTGALGKITQITFGALDPGNSTTNLMTAHVTGGVGLHAADLLTDLKSGWILRADPRQQFWAQFLGVVAGSIFVVPAFHLLVPTAADVGGDKWPAPAAQTWKGVALLLARGFDALHPTAQAGLVIGGVVGVVLVVMERFLPRLRRYIPSPAGLGLGFTSPGYNTISIFLGAAAALVFARLRPPQAERATVPVASGMLAGESLVGVLVAALVAFGLIEG
jgi:uncharacterized oligopeptide transporter (OPT) family protein